MLTAASAPTLDPARLRSVPMFSDWSWGELHAVLCRTALVTADAGERLVVEGDRSDYAFVILSGVASVTRRDRTLATLGAGDLFGETAMVAGGVRTATVTAITAVELLRLDAETVAEVTGTHTMAWHMLRSLLERTGHGRHVPAGPDLVEDDLFAEKRGEDLRVAERIVVAPGVGVFHPCSPNACTAEGEIVTAGQIVGFVSALDERTEVRSPFAGFLMGMLALDGERVRAGQPIAWLRTF